METINGHPVPKKSAIENKMEEARALMEKTPGISNVKTSADWENYIATISCNFTGIAQLNKAIKTIKLKEKAKDPMLADYYTYDVNAGLFQRKNNFSLKETYVAFSKADKEVFSNALFTSIFKFDSPVADMSNKNARLSANKKAVMLRENALDIMTEKKSIENNINLTNK